MTTKQTLPNISKGARIGLLGGSFNPAHSGHLFISDAALDKLGLDQVWWLVSPGNPLKDNTDLAPLPKRIKGAQEITQGKNIEVVDFEGPNGLVYTVDTVAALKAACPDAFFVWLMGADCFAQMPKWKSWQDIMQMVPVALFPRPDYTAAALGGEAAIKYAKFKLAEDNLKTLSVTHLPCWGYIDIEEQDISSTNLRETRLAQKRKDSRLYSSKSPQPKKVSEKSNASIPLLEAITTSLEDDKAIEISVIELEGKSSIADQMVIASGSSRRHVGAIAHHLQTNLKEGGYGRPQIEGMPQGDWVLIDAGDVIVHLFRPEVRGYYNLEKMWTADIDQED